MSGHTRAPGAPRRPAVRGPRAAGGGRRRIQYRARRVDGMLLEPARDAMLLRNRDGHHYLVDGPRTWLILGPDGTLPAPDGMAPGIYREADRPNTLWLRDADGLKHPRLAAASIIDGYAPWFRLAVRHEGFRLSYRPF